MKWVIFPDCPKGKCNGANYVVILDIRDLDERYHWYPSMQK